MTAQNHPYPRVEMLLDAFAGWLKHRRELNEMRQLDTAEFDRIANDLRISPGDLNDLVRQGPRAADELPRLLDALGIDEEALVRTEPMLLRDMARVCALCHHKRQCDRDLFAGTSAEHYQGYCPNAPSINDLARPANH